VFPYRRFVDLDGFVDIIREIGGVGREMREVLGRNWVMRKSLEKLVVGLGECLSL
jgi:hypothetical protein